MMKEFVLEDGFISSSIQGNKKVSGETKTIGMKLSIYLLFSIQLHSIDTIDDFYGFNLLTGSTESKYAVPTGSKTLSSDKYSSADGRGQSKSSKNTASSSSISGNISSKSKASSGHKSVTAVSRVYNHNGFGPATGTYSL